MRITVNDKRTIANFGTVFSNATKLYSELIQNARRAGATQVDFTTIATDDQTGIHTVTIKDNGTGIADFGSLLCLSESDWDDATTGQENPFGMGFFAAFYTADRVSVLSRGQRLDIDCESAKQLEDIGEPVADPTAPERGTEIILEGVKFDHAALAQLATYSSIPITVDGLTLIRDMCLEALAKHHPVVETPFGTLVQRFGYELGVTVILQDQVVYQPIEFSLRAYSNVLFANHTLTARAPDRDRLIEEEATVERVQQWLREHFVKTLAETREAMGDDVAFVTAHFAAIMNYAPKMLNDIPFLPGEAFENVPYPNQRVPHFWEKQSSETSITADTVSDHIILAVDPGTDDLLAGNFAYFSDALVLAANLDPDHWVRAHVIELEGSDIVIGLEGAVIFPFDAGRIQGEAIAADRIMLEHTPSKMTAEVISDGFALIDSCEFCHPASVSLLIDRVASDALPDIIFTKNLYAFDELVLQLRDYRDDDSDERLDGDRDDDATSLARQAAVATGGDVLQILSDAVGALPPAIVQQLKGKSLAATVEDTGELRFQIAS